MFETVAVIGGDLRQLTLARLLKQEGYHVFLYGFDKDIKVDTPAVETDRTYVLNADIIILPVPVTFDGTTVNSPYANTPMQIDEFLDGVNPSALVFGGQIQPNLQRAFEEHGIAYRDYLKREELSVKNAVPTALVIWLWIFDFLCTFDLWKQITQKPCLIKVFGLFAVYNICSNITLYLFPSQSINIKPTLYDFLLSVQPLESYH